MFFNRIQLQKVVIYQFCFIKMGLDAFAKGIGKSIDPCHPEQADMGGNFSLSLTFYICQRTILYDDSVGA